MENFSTKIFVLWNIAVFLFYGLDKFFARADMRRVSEKALIGSSFLLGGIGAFFGMQIFRHKTRKTKFQMLIPLFAVLTLAFYVYVLR